jgi:hypothetical protein
MKLLLAHQNTAHQRLPERDKQTNRSISNIILKKILNLNVSKMMVLLRVHVLSLLVGSVSSLNHGNFIGDGNVDGVAPDMPPLEDFFHYFTPLPPVPTTPSPVIPTNRPTKEPTPSPVITPTRPPVPAGRFPTPVAKPVPAPYNIQHQPPTFLPHPYSNEHPVEPQHKVETRIASYNAEWGSDVNYCDHVIPNVFFNCHGGGVIGIKEKTNAKCTRVGNDRVQCTQEDVDTDSSIEFTCSGVEKVHLMSTATVGPNLVTNCARDGNVVKYLTLGRACTDFTDTNPTCDGGMPVKQNDVSYCATPTVCTGQDTCSELKLEPLAMSNTNTKFACSRVDPDQDLQFHSFYESYLSSLSVIDWRISGQKRGCLWKSAPLLIRCEGGGILEFEEDYPFCSMINEGKDIMGQCQSFAPYSSGSEESIRLSVTCTGNSESQLNLSIEIPSQDLNVQCDSEGTIIQSVMLSRGCGEVGTDEFTLVNHPSFCDAEEQVFTVDDNHAHCFVGNTCLSNNGCSNMQLPHLTADTGSGPIGKCTYVV